MVKFMENKELDALERGILEFEKELEDDCNNEWLKRVVAGMKKCYQRLKSIDNANPSEAMRCLEELGEIGTDDINNQDIMLKDDNDFKDYYNTIKNYILKAQEQEKVLEILKSKKYIPLEQINPKFWDNEEDYDETVDYEFYLWLCEEECEYVVKEEQKLTQEEFELLKRYYKEKNKKEE